MDTISSMRFYKNSEIDKVLDYDSLINGLEEALGQFSSSDSKINQPNRLWLKVPEHNGVFGNMPVYSGYNDVIATKLITFFPLNKDLPTHNALIVTFDGKDGSPKAILDGDVITAKRTAAASAVATKYLVNGEPKVMALLGAGVQAESHYDALSHLYKFQEVRIWNRTKSKAETLATKIGNGIACDSVEEAVKDADVICTITSTTTPILMAKWVKEGAHINAVGAPLPDRAELEPELMRSSVVYADTKSLALKDSGDVLLSQAEIYAEIGEVINGTKEAMRTKTTIFKSLGMALEDAVSAKIVFDKLD